MILGHPLIINDAVSLVSQASNIIWQQMLPHNISSHHLASKPQHHPQTILKHWHWPHSTKFISIKQSSVKTVRILFHRFVAYICQNSSAAKSSEKIISYLFLPISGLIRPMGPWYLIRNVYFIVLVVLQEMMYDGGYGSLVSPIHHFLLSSHYLERSRGHSATLFWVVFSLQWNKQHMTCY